MKKRMLALCIMSVCLFAFTACGNNDGSNNAQSISNVSPENSEVNDSNNDLESEVSTDTDAENDYDGEILESEWVTYDDTLIEDINDYADHRITITLTGENLSDTTTITIHGINIGTYHDVVLCEENGYSVTYTSVSDNYEIVSACDSNSQEIERSKYSCLYVKDVTDSAGEAHHSEKTKQLHVDASEHAYFTFTLK